MTAFLNTGSEENELVFYLGQGWYCGRFICENQTQIYGEKPAVSWILQLKFADGSKKEIDSGIDVDNWNLPMNMPENMTEKYTLQMGEIM